MLLDSVIIVLVNIKFDY